MMAKEAQFLLIILLGERFKWEKDIDSCFDQIV
jgi:hypothetical protein